MTDKMTSEQTIKVLKNLEMQLACESFTKALGVAVEALEQQERWQEFFRDLFDEESDARYKVVKL